MLHLERAQPMLGSTFIERMTGKKHAILRIGNEYFTRHQLVTQVGTGNFLAARNLQKLVDDLKLSTVRDLYHLSPYELAGTHGVGTTTIFVLMSIFEAKGLNIQRWMMGKGTKEDVVTWDSLKHRATRLDAAAAKNEKRAIAKSERKQAHKRTKEYIKERTRQTKRNGHAQTQAVLNDLAGAHA